MATEDITVSKKLNDEKNKRSNYKSEKYHCPVVVASTFFKMYMIQNKLSPKSKSIIAHSFDKTSPHVFKKMIFHPGRLAETSFLLDKGYSSFHYITIIFCHISKKTNLNVQFTCCLPTMTLVADVVSNKTGCLSSQQTLIIGFWGTRRIPYIPTYSGSFTL